MGGKVYLVKGYYKKGDKYPFYSYEHDLPLKRCKELADILYRGECGYAEVIDLETLEQVYQTKQNK